jgi:concanavalin A-like lectin/glucanase superfamily protein
MPYRPVGGRTHGAYRQRASQAPASSILTGLVSYWKMDEVSGTRDDVLGANNLTDNNTVAQAAGKINNAGLYVAANSEYLSNAAPTGLGFAAAPFTLQAWVYLDSKATRQMFIMKGGAGGDEYFLEYENATDRFRFFILDSTANYVGVTADTFGAPSTATWYHLVAKLDSVGMGISIQVNAGTADTGVITNTDADRSQPFQIGSYRGSAFFADGRIDEVGVWGRVLTAQEITDLYGGGSGLAYPFS